MSIPTRVDVRAHRAKPIGNQIPPRTTIVIDPVLPDRPAITSGTLAEALLHPEMEADAKAITDALFGALPGGTLDRILMLFLERKLSTLHVLFRG